MTEQVRTIVDYGELRFTYGIRKGTVLDVVAYDDPATKAEKFEPKRAGCTVNIGPGRNIHLYSYEYELADETGEPKPVVIEEVVGGPVSAETAAKNQDE